MLIAGLSCLLVHTVSVSCCSWCVLEMEGNKLTILSIRLGVVCCLDKIVEKHHVVSHVFRCQALLLDYNMKKLIAPRGVCVQPAVPGSINPFILNTKTSL